MTAGDGRSAGGRGDSSCGGVLLKWIVPLVLPGLFWSACNYFADQEAAQERARKDEQWRRQLLDAKPDEAGPTTRMSLGIEDADRAAGGVANEPAAATDDQQLIAPKQTVDCGNPQE